MHLFDITRRTLHRVSSISQKLRALYDRKRVFRQPIESRRIAAVIVLGSDAELYPAAHKLLTELKRLMECPTYPVVTDKDFQTLLDDADHYRQVMHEICEAETTRKALVFSLFPSDQCLRETAHRIKGSLTLPRRRQPHGGWTTVPTA